MIIIYTLVVMTLGTDLLYMVLFYRSIYDLLGQWLSFCLTDCKQKQGVTILQLI